MLRRGPGAYHRILQVTGQGESGPAIRLSFLDDLCAFSCSMAYLLQSPIQTPVLYGLGDVGGLDLFGSLEVGDGAADFEDAAVGAGAQAQFIDRHFEQLFSPFFDHAEALDIFCSHLGIGMDAPFFKALELDGARAVDPLPDNSRRFSSISACQLLVADCRYFDLNVNPVE